MHSFLLDLKEKSRLFMQDAASWMSSSRRKRSLVPNGPASSDQRGEENDTRGPERRRGYFIFFFSSRPRADKRRALIRESKCGHAPRQTYLYKRGGAGKVQETERGKKKKIKTQTKPKEKKKRPTKNPTHMSRLMHRRRYAHRGQL